MPKLLCTLPNASEEISGVKFVSHANGMLSEDVSDEVAANFASIPGYEIVGAEPKKAPEKTPAPEDAAKAAERAELVAKAESLGVKVKGNWSIERLAAEVKAAEEAKATEEAGKTESAPAAEGGEQAKTPAAE